MTISVLKLTPCPCVKRLNLEVNWGILQPFGLFLV
nr:MAG TPA: hypothetical protein [Caudoviricetes sp.]